jgi:nucleotide-binding universal stress UspA family protein
MNRQILLGVDTDFSPLTQQAIQVTCELIASSSSSCTLTLLAVIPLGQIVTMHPGLYMGHVETLLPSLWQQQQAEEALRKARLLLHQRGCTHATIEGVVRTGTPGDEIVKAARESYADLIILGSHSDSLFKRLRQLCGGSITQHVQRQASCPVLLVVPARVPLSPDLVAWYSTAIHAYLRDHAQLSVFTPEQVATKFALPNQKTPGKREIEAAARALERLAAHGTLCRHDVKGEVCYTND